jgi:hypothetical protein
VPSTASASPRRSARARRATAVATGLRTAATSAWATRPAAPGAGLLQFEGGARIPAQPGQQADAPSGDTCGAGDIPLGHQPGGHGVVRRADQQRVGGLAGQVHGPPGPFDGLCPGQAGIPGLGGGGGVEGRLPLRRGRVGAVEPGRLGPAPGQVPAAGAFAIIVGVEPGRGELADRFQGVVAHPPGAGHGHQQAVFGEPAQRVRHLGRLHRVAPRHYGRRGGTEWRGEYRYPAQHRLLARIQQPVTPVQRVVQGAVPLLLPGAAGQQAQLVAQARFEAVQAQGRQPGRGQFDRQRQARDRPGRRGIRPRAGPGRGGCRRSACAAARRRGFPRCVPR